MKQWLIYASLASVMLFANCDAQTLSLDAVFHSTKKFFPKIIQARLSQQRAHALELQAHGAFDTTIKSKLETQQGNGYVSRYTEQELNIPLIYHGASVALGYRNGRGLWPSYYQYNRTNTGGELVARFNLPLLRGGAIDSARLKLMNQVLNTHKVTEQLRQTLANTLWASGQAYWDWVRYGQRYGLAKSLLKLAKIRQHALHRRVVLGDAAHIELVENNRILLQRQVQVTEAQLKFIQASRQLSLYYRNHNGSPHVPGVQELPQKIPNIIVGIHPVGYRRSFLIYHNPELRMLDLNKKMQYNVIRFEHNQYLPRLNWSLEWDKQYGQGGDPRLLPGGVNTALTFQVPIQQREAAGRLDAAKIHLTIIQQRLTLTVQQLKVIYQNTVQELQAYKVQVSLLKSEVKLAKKIEQAERRKFSQGDSNLFLVNQRETTTFSLQGQAIDRLAAYHKSKLQLQSLCAFECHMFKNVIE